ncbi:MAG: aldehyde dehydrogenase family protein [Candidatus Humimicrobiaceae bacterium]
MEKKLYDDDLISMQQARQLSSSAKTAYDLFSTGSQEKVDKVVEAMALAGIKESERLARLAVEETGYGIVEDKIIKNIFASRDVYESIKDLKTAGVISRDNVKKIIEIAHPMGVVAAITPTTNPTSTVIFKALICVKSRNAVVFAPHPHAVRCSFEAARVMAEAAVSAGAPAGLISCMYTLTLEGTKELMASKNVAIILATGGPAMVKSAHSYGKPALGVGPGNTPVYVDKSADIEKAAKDIISSKSFDNGVICASEEAVIVHKDVEGQLRNMMIKNGAYFLSESEIEKAGKVLVKGNSMNAEMVGKSVQIIADAAGINVPAGTKLLVGQLLGVGPQYPLSREILSPIVAYYIADNWIEGCERCLELINFGGVGHTMVIHSMDEEVITEFAHRKPVFRFLVNTPASQGAVGITTSLSPSLTLSTGAWGGGISSDNISAYHLMNIKRVAYETKPINPPGFETSNSSSGIYSGNSTRNLIEDIVTKVIENIYLNKT